MSLVRCCACQSPMQVLFFAGVELDACTGCGGVWFDMDELDRIVDRRPEFTPSAGTTDRDCPRCAYRMRPGFLQRGVRVERCTPCRGFFLDAGELDAIAGRHVPLPEVRAGSAASPAPSEDGPPPGVSPAFWGEPTRQVAQSGFACVVCSMRFPMSDGNFFRGGLACPECTPQVKLTKGERVAANGGTVGTPFGIWGPEYRRTSFFDVLIGFFDSYPRYL